MKIDEIIKALRTTPSRSKRTLLDAAAAMIEQMLDRCARYADEIAVLQEKTRWIPVEEQLPEDGVEVLCWYEYFRYGDFNAMVSAYGTGYQFHGIWGGEVSNGKNAKVLAWMPLPDGPEATHD